MNSPTGKPPRHPLSRVLTKVRAADAAVRPLSRTGALRGLFLPPAGRAFEPEDSAAGPEHCKFLVDLGCRLHPANEGGWCRPVGIAERHYSKPDCARYRGPANLREH